MADYVTASNGAQLDLSSLAQTITYNGELVESVSVTLNSVVYTQTFTNNGTKITTSTQWVNQP